MQDTETLVASFLLPVKMQIFVIILKGKDHWGKLIYYFAKKIIFINLNRNPEMVKVLDNLEHADQIPVLKNILCQWKH